MFLRSVSLVFLTAAIIPSHAAVIGTNPPSQPVTFERIATLPKYEQAAWKKYLQQSERQKARDKAVLRNELRKLRLTASKVPPGGRAGRNAPLNRAAEWYAQPEARRIADIVVSFQTPAGGWSKNMDLQSHQRAPGEGFAPNNESRFPSTGDNDQALDGSWSYVGTFDNNATITQLRFLAKVISANKSGTSKYRRAFLKGIDYILAAQYPNGGWPQVWPLQGGYHDAVTFNDGAMSNIMNFLRDVSEGTGQYAFVPASVRKKAAQSFKRGVDCVLACQIMENGRLTAWCQQHDAITLRATSARNYEMPSICAAESAGIMGFLMQLTNPSPRVVAAVRAAAAWLEKAEIRDVAFKRVQGERKLLPAEGNGPLWARYYEIGSDRPIFGDRDKTIHDDVNEISKERRNGYSWYNNTAAQALEQFAKWNEARQ